MTDMHYLELLSSNYPNIGSAASEIINLSAILNLPKGTEHFMSDIHGEADAFLHVLNNASGVIREKIDKVFQNSLPATDKRALAALIYYPEREIERMRTLCADMDDWYKVMLYRLIDVCRSIASKYTRKKVRRAMPKVFSYVIDELLHGEPDLANKTAYYENIVASIIKTRQAAAFIGALSALIKRMAVDRLHIVGDIFDRGPGADIILDKLTLHHSVDIEWGNHDCLWMGAAAGSKACIAAVLMNTIKYGNLDMLEKGYGINLLPWALFASGTYKDAGAFTPKVYEKRIFEDDLLAAKMEKAMFIIQMKLEGQLVSRRPEYNMADRDMLSRIDYSDMSIVVDGKRHTLIDTELITVDPREPNRLTDGEAALMEQLADAFAASDKLQAHTRFLYGSGSVYLKINGNLLYHGCVPVTPEGEFMELSFGGGSYRGRELFDKADALARRAFLAAGSEEADEGRDFLWFLWCGRNSPLFGRDHIATFERALIADKETWVEPKNAYYSLYEDEAFCLKVLAEFDLGGEFSHIINGHVPVRVKKGEGPIKGGGRLIVIDGGFCRAYHEKTGIAGYTMFFSSHGLRLAAHQPFTTLTDAIENDRDKLDSRVENIDLPTRMLVSDTDTGKRLAERISELKRLCCAYRSGQIKERML